MRAVSAAKKIYIRDENGFLLKNQEYERMKPTAVCISLKQGEAEAAEAAVKEGETVVCGQLIGVALAEGAIPVYASIDGIVEEIKEVSGSFGECTQHVVIRNHSGIFSDNEKRYLNSDGSVLEKLKEIGIVENGKHGTAFYHRCLERQNSSKLILMAFDVEPFVYSEYRLIMECPSKIIFGAQMLTKALGIDTLSIYCYDEEVRYILEKTVQTYAKVIKPLEKVQFILAQSKYPLGNEFRTDSDLICNPTQLAAVYDGLYDERPMTGRGITVCGDICRPKNLWVPNGTSVRAILEYCGGLAACSGKVDQRLLEHCGYCAVEGGPMQGVSVNIDQASISLATSAVLLIKAHLGKEMPCIGCGRCAEICPGGLNPASINVQFLKTPEKCKNIDLTKCSECGWCSFVCPSKRRLQENIAIAKKDIFFEPVSREDDVDTQYIELDEEMAALMEPLDQVSLSAPYIKSSEKIQSLMFKALIGVFIAAIGMVWLYGSDFLVYGSVSLFTCIAIEALYEYYSGQSIRITDGSSAVTGMIIAIALYQSVSARFLMGADIVAILLGKCVFGGIGKNKLNPAVTGILLIRFFQMLIFSGADVQVTSASLPLLITFFAAFVYMFFLKIIRITPVLLFSGLCLLGKMLYLLDFTQPAAVPAALLAAVFMLNDYVTIGRNARRQNLMAVACGCLAMLLASVLPTDLALFLPVFAANIMTCILTTETI